jgi:hypothetical protein
MCLGPSARITGATSAGHFIQEDVGAEMAAQVVEFIQVNPIPDE